MWFWELCLAAFCWCFLAVSSAGVPLGRRCANRFSEAYLHGWVDKAGTPPESRWHHSYHGAMWWEQEQWLKRNSERVGFVARGKMMPSLCQVWINHEYRFIWVRQPKAAGSWMVAWLEAALRRQTCPSASSEEPCAVWELEGLNQFWMPPSVKATLKLSESTPEQAKQWWREYLVFTFLRNPVQRAVSGFKYLTAAHPCPGKTGRVPDLYAFCSDPGVVAYGCYPKDIGRAVHNVHHVAPPGCLLAEAGAGDGGVSKAGSRLPPRGLAVDFIGRTEALVQDLAALVREINRRRPNGTLALPEVTDQHAGKRVNSLVEVAHSFNASFMEPKDEMKCECEWRLAEYLKRSPANMVLYPPLD